MIKVSLSSVPQFLRAVFVMSAFWFVEECMLTNASEPWYTTTVIWPKVVSDVLCLVVKIGEEIEYFFWRSVDADFIAL